ncbi:MAG: 2-oxoacid:acceptor oxidoreductase family protein [Pyramidobacter sp.]
MWEFKFYSRGGQGAVTAAKMLVNAAIHEGKFAQAIPSYGQERKGAPVFTYARIADAPIEVKSYVYHPNCVICFDTSLSDLGIDITEGAQPGAVLVVNSGKKYLEDKFSKVVNLDADKLPHEILGEVPPNTAMLGIVAKATGCVSIESLVKAIESKIPGKAGELNAKACRTAYENA